MKTKSMLLTGAALIVAAAIYGVMQNSNMSAMTSMNHSGMAASAADSDATKAYQAAMDKMHMDMMKPPTGKPDLDFITGMIPHHQGAIDMAKAVLQYGKDPDIKTLAENVVKAQNGEITMMKDWLSKADQTALAGAPESAAANEAAMGQMMKSMMVTYKGDADVDFVTGMIPHHQGAIDMAKVALQYAKDPAVLKLAQDVVTAQEGEIAFMQDWLKKKGM
jgi:uncharacterized protein (DUF305 family)